MNLADLFTPTTLSKAIVALPKPATVLGDAGIFKPEPVKTTTVTVESINGRLVLVQNTDRRGDPQPKGKSKRVRRTFEIPHLPKSTTILPDELNVSGFGTETIEAQSVVINNRLQELKNDIEATKEFHRVGAISGLILDADGTTVIYNLFDEFGVTQKNINIAFSNVATDVRAKLLEAKRHASKQLGGAIVKKWLCYCSSTFFDGLTGHDSVREAYKGYQEAADRLGGDKRNGFKFADIEFIEYDVEVVGTDGELVKYIADGIGRLVPITDDLFKTYYAPANYNSAVNTLGQEIYAVAEERPKGKGWDLEAQSNPLPMCTAPSALVKLTAT